MEGIYDDELGEWKHLSCFHEVDLEYPEVFPLAHARVKIENTEQLIPNLNNKTNYVVHYEKIKLYEKLGLKITKVHTGTKFEESSWLEEYINLNTNLRIEAM